MTTCLICDDFPANGTILKLLINRITSKYDNIDIVKSRPELQNYLMTHNPDCIFLDVIYGDHEDIRPHINNIRNSCTSEIILYTGLPHSCVQEIMDEYNIKHVLYKPVSKKSVEEILNHM